jgi:hypothetical protein
MSPITPSFLLPAATPTATIQRKMVSALTKLLDYCSKLRLRTSHFVRRIISGIALIIIFPSTVTAESGAIVLLCNKERRGRR